MAERVTISAPGSMVDETSFGSQPRRKNDRKRRGDHSKSAGKRSKGSRGSGSGGKRGDAASKAGRNRKGSNGSIGGSLGSKGGGRKRSGSKPKVSKIRSGSKTSDGSRGSAPGMPPTVPGVAAPAPDVPEIPAPTDAAGNGDVIAASGDVDAAVRLPHSRPSAGHRGGDRAQASKTVGSDGKRSDGKRSDGKRNASPGTTRPPTIEAPSSAVAAATGSGTRSGSPVKRKGSASGKASGGSSNNNNNNNSNKNINKSNDVNLGRSTGLGITGRGINVMAFASEEPFKPWQSNDSAVTTESGHKGRGHNFNESYRDVMEPGATAYHDEYAFEDEKPRTPRRPWAGRR